MQKQGQKTSPTLPGTEITKGDSNIARVFKRFLRRCYRLVRSTIGLLILLISYSFAGAALFQYLESGNESNEKSDVINLRESIIERVLHSSRNISISDDTWRNLVREELHQYEGELYDAFSHGISTDSTLKQWDFWGSFLFCATVYTTIGYGHIAPATYLGRISCILYAVIGIPLCLIVMADLGKLFTKGLKFIWSFVRRFYYTGNCTKKTEVRPIGTAPGTTGAAGAAGKPGAKKTQTDDVYVVDDEFNLPPIVAILIAVVYLLIGALLYIQWEDWTYLEAFYFLFVSVSTIGFGDVLPDHPRYFLATSLYVLVGLSLVAMVINVIMESLSSTITKAKETVADVGKTIGIPLEDLLADIEEEEYEQQKKGQHQLKTVAQAVKNGTKK